MNALLAAALLVLVAGCGNATTLDDDGGPRVLVFSKTTGFRHTSISTAVDALRTIGDEEGFAVDATEDAAFFTDEGLEPYEVVVFALTTGTLFDDAQRAAFERYIAKGRGYVGIHSAADTEYEWPFYGALVGTYFHDHPAIQTATVRVVVDDHPSTTELPAEWVREDEWYNYIAPPTDVTVLARLDESTYEGGGMGDDHPIAWFHDFGGGRAFYTGGGHTEASYAEPLFVAHLRGGLRFARGVP
jgi:type 1 glutamine amidotransferase